jgi:hypothetical protein
MRVALLDGCSASAIHGEQAENAPKNAPIFDEETLGGCAFYCFIMVFQVSAELELRHIF